MRAKLFWKLGLTYLVFLLLGVLFAVDLYSARVLRRDYIAKRTIGSPRL